MKFSSSWKRLDSPCMELQWARLQLTRIMAAMGGYVCLNSFLVSMAPPLTRLSRFTLAPYPIPISRPKSRVPNLFYPSVCFHLISTLEIFRTTSRQSVILRPVAEWVALRHSFTYFNSFIPITAKFNSQGLIILQ